MCKMYGFAHDMELEDCSLIKKKETKSLLRNLQKKKNEGPGLINGSYN